ncbi:hypothetical protein [Chryseobacterium schmidteae]|uniref:hypothetical protein n=1 Tax=Chryseobacterium schmidteae TaxID=2730404 RepID=UPI00158C8A61|nr:hypothetical protein [Chryseobacterium schmidteae]
MKKIFSFFILTIGIQALNAQVLISDGPVASPVPNSNAILELKSVNNNKGILMPKVSLTATNNPSPFASHLAGITVYNTNRSSVTILTAVTPGFYYNDGTSWQKLEVQLPTIGDIKYASQSADHDGWYLLDGRAISSFPTLAANNASSLGFTTNIPNASDKFLKAKTGAEVLGNTGGNASVTLLQANLPNITYSGNTNTNGNHTHQYNDRASGVTTSVEVGSTRTIVDDTSSGTLTTGSSGNHTHTFTVSTGGSGTPLNLQPKYLSTYVFVYLGQ